MDRFIQETASINLTGLNMLPSYSCWLGSQIFFFGTKVGSEVGHLLHFAVFYLLNDLSLPLSTSAAISFLVKSLAFK
jgi:hypothetical protein